MHHVSEVIAIEEGHSTFERSSERRIDNGIPFLFAGQNNVSNMGSRKIREFWELLPVLIGVGVYAIIYSYLTVAKFNSFNATSADLGINANLLYGVFHGGVSFLPGNSNFINTGKLIYIFIAPFYNIYPSEKVLLVFQSIWIPLGAVPIYFIAKRRFGHGFIAYALSFSWLMYYPMAGANWFDFHFMALFPTFFLMGQAFLEYGRKNSTILFFILAAITDFLIPVVMILYSIIKLVKNRKLGIEPSENRLWITLTIVSASILLITNILYGPKYTLDYLIHGSTLMGTAFQASQWYIFPYFFWILLPLGFLSLLAPDYLLLLVPFFILAGVSAYSPYLDTMFEQYASLTAPIVFLAAIVGLDRMKGAKLRKLRIHHMGRKTAGIIFAISTCFALVFTPAGNTLTGNFQNPSLEHILTGERGSYNTLAVMQQTNADKAMWWMISLIPPGSSVMAQDNFPQLYQGYHYFWPSYVLGNLSQHGYPQYAIVDPHNVFYDHTVFPGENSTYTAQNAFNALYNTGKYGILAEYDGIELIEYNYAGHPLIFAY